MAPLNGRRGSKVRARVRHSGLRQLLLVLGFARRPGGFCRRAETSRRAAATVVVVSHEFWQTRLAAPFDVVGQTVRVNDRELTVVGVTPDGFQGTVLGLQFDLWMPATLAPALVLAGLRARQPRQSRLLRAGAAGSRARRRPRPQPRWSDDAATGARIPRPTRVTARGPAVLAARRAGRSGLLMQALAMLQGVMLLLLLAVCGNTANLVLARASARSARWASGWRSAAGRWRVVRLLLAREPLLALGGAAVGTCSRSGAPRRCARCRSSRRAFPVRFQTERRSGPRWCSRSAWPWSRRSLLGALAPAWHLRPTRTRLRAARRRRAHGRGRLRNCADGRRGRAGPRRAAGRRHLLPQLRRDARAVDPGFRARACCWPPTTSRGRARDGGWMAAAVRANACWPPRAHCPTWRPRRIATRRCRSTSTACRSVRSSLEGRAASDGGIRSRAQQHRHARLLRDDGHSVRRGRRLRPLGDAAAPPQVIVNEAFVRRYVADGAVARPPHRVRRPDATRSSASCATRPTTRSASRPRRPSTSRYRDRPRTAGRDCTCARVRAPRRCSRPASARIVRELEPALPLFNVRTLADHVEIEPGHPAHAGALVRGARAAAAGARGLRHLRRRGVRGGAAHAGDRRASGPWRIGAPRDRGDRAAEPARHRGRGGWLAGWRCMASTSTSRQASR